MCENCSTRWRDDKFYCDLCKLSLEAEEDDDMSIKPKLAKPSGFKSTASVKLNTKTGMIEGWDSLFALLDMEDQDSKKLKEEIGKTTGKVVERLRNRYNVEQKDTDTFHLIDIRAGTTELIQMKIDMQGKVTFEGLPEEFIGPLGMFSDEEQRMNPLSVL